MNGKDREFCAVNDKDREFCAVNGKDREFCAVNGKDREFCDVNSKEREFCDVNGKDLLDGGNITFMKIQENVLHEGRFYLDETAFHENNVSKLTIK